MIEPGEPEIEAGHGFEDEFDVNQLSPEEQELHRRANRVAKVSMQDIKMLRPEQVRLGRERRSLQPIETTLKKLIENTTGVSNPSWTTQWIIFIVGWWKSSRRAMHTLSANTRTPRLRGIAEIAAGNAGAARSWPAAALSVCAMMLAFGLLASGSGPPAARRRLAYSQEKEN